MTSNSKILCHCFALPITDVISDIAAMAESRLTTSQRKLLVYLIIASSAILLYLGWNLFWHLTDDAFIAFRYVSNSILGYGYTWNPPPFKPVEGYTSFLWVVLLDVVWRGLGIEPPQSANYLSLGFAFLTLLITVRIVLRQHLSVRLSSHRLVFLALVMAGVLTNRTFLASTSSGLETALFNAGLLWWLSILVFANGSTTSWLFKLSLAAALVSLTRPDGYLFVVATLVIAAFVLVHAYREGTSRRPHFFAPLPLAIPAVHIMWRYAYYGEWLPNTYYAKYVAPWPEAGWRYLASFILEYAFWFGLLGLIIVLARQCQKRSFHIPRASEPDVEISEPDSEGKVAISCGRARMTVAVAAVAVHVAYYTLVIGGDHFEYRVYSYLIPLIFVSLIWIVDRLQLNLRAAATLVGLSVLLSWPLPWAHWLSTLHLPQEQFVQQMYRPVSQVFPSFLHWYTGTFDSLQERLIDHLICVRHQTHRAFCEEQLRRYPARSLECPSPFPLYRTGAVGVAGWVLPRVVIIDLKGLNDYVIARTPVPAGRARSLAHERVAPEGYLESFPVSFAWLETGKYGFIELDSNLSSEEISTTEAYWLSRTSGRKEIATPSIMLMRQGESKGREKNYEEAIPLLRDAIYRDPTLCAAYSMLASCYVQSGRADSALSVIRSAAPLAGCGAMSLSRLGLIAQEYVFRYSDSARNRFSEILDLADYLLRSALEKDSERVTALVGLASIALFRDLPDSSERVLSRLEALNELPPETLEILIRRLAWSRHSELARRTLDLAVRHGMRPETVARLQYEYPIIR